MAIINDLKWEDGELYNPPLNPLRDKWKEKYPPTPKPEYSQVCDGYSCMWCWRCPHGEYWKVPEEDKEIYDKWVEEYNQYMDKHGGIEKLLCDIDEKEIAKWLKENGGGRKMKKLVIELDKVAYDLIIGKIETANIDLYSTLIKSVQNGTPLEEELEKIKAEFEEIKGQRDNPYNNKTEYSVSMKELREVFEKHISELKGENNE